jgi:hypothetical protein
MGKKQKTPIGKPLSRKQTDRQQVLAIGRRYVISLFVIEDFVRQAIIQAKNIDPTHLAVGRMMAKCMIEAEKRINRGEKLNEEVKEGFFSVYEDEEDYKEGGGFEAVYADVRCIDEVAEKKE